LIAAVPSLLGVWAKLRSIFGAAPVYGVVILMVTFIIARALRILRGAICIGSSIGVHVGFLPRANIGQEMKDVLDEANADPVGFAPSDAAGPFNQFWLNEQREVVGNANRAFHYQLSARFRHVADHAINCGGHTEYDRPTFKSP